MHNPRRHGSIPGVTRSSPHGLPSGWAAPEEVARHRPYGPCARSERWRNGIPPAGPLSVRRVRPFPQDPDEHAELTERLLAAYELLDSGVFDWDVASGSVRYYSPRSRATEPVADREGDLGGRLVRLGASRRCRPRERGRRPGAPGRDGDVPSFYRRRLGHGVDYVQASGKVISRGSDGRALRMIGIYRDMTTPVSAERGRQAREAAVRDAQVRAALSEFASSLAHELNQPLAALSTNAQAALRLLDSGPSGRKDAREALVRSVALAERAADVVRAMRQVLRPGSRPQEPLDLAALAREVCDLVEPEARRVDVVLRLVRPKGPVVVTADRGQVELLLLNLVRNAIEAIAAARRLRRTVEVRVRTGPAVVRLEVDDTRAGNRPGRPRPYLRRLLHDEGGRNRARPPALPDLRRGARGQARLRPGPPPQGGALHPRAAGGRPRRFRPGAETAGPESARASRMTLVSSTLTSRLMSRAGASRQSARALRDLGAAEAVGDEASDLRFPGAEGGAEREEALRRFAAPAP